MTPVQTADLCGVSVSEGEIEGHPRLTILNPPDPHPPYSPPPPHPQDQSLAY